MSIGEIEKQIEIWRAKRDEAQHQMDVLQGIIDGWIKVAFEALDKELKSPAMVDEIKKTLKNR